MTEAYPLQWPEGWPRTPWHNKDPGHRFTASPAQARESLFLELSRLGAKDIVVSTDQILNKNGSVRVSARAPDDPGVSVYFTLRGRQMVMASDRYKHLHHNMRSIALAVEAMRQLERHGGGHMMERAFQGFEALPAPGQAHSAAWWRVLGVNEDASADEINQAYREKARKAHPDAGGNQTAMAELNAARAEALSLRAA